MRLAHVVADVRAIPAARHVEAAHQEAGDQEEDHHAELPGAFPEHRAEEAGLVAEVRERHDERRESAQPVEGGNSHPIRAPACR
jgi:hypothetical protein